jgi:hypothetical protein
MKIYFTGAALAMILAAPAYSACTVPSGGYVGIGTGDVYSGSTLTNHIESTFVMTVSANGSGTLSETGKTIAGRYTASATFPARGTTGNTFNATTCAGSQTLSNGKVYVYTVNNSGAEIHWMYYGADTISYNYSISFRRP